MRLVSVMRDSASYVDRYMEQVLRLRKLVGDVSVTIVEGDSTDNTWERLGEYRTFTNIDVLKVEHGGPYYPSFDIARRWRQLAVVCNVAMTAATRDLEDDEPLVYVESDLIWTPETIQQLVKHLDHYPAIAPLSICGARFYDIWGYSKDGARFGPWPPYHRSLARGEIDTIDTAGSCIAMRGDVAKLVEFSQVDCIRGVGRSLYEHGFSLWLDPTLRVTHP
jgi:hypothetical protein